jgi:hypothetical protein
MSLANPASEPERSVILTVDDFGIADALNWTVTGNLPSVIMSIRISTPAWDIGPALTNLAAATSTLEDGFMVLCREQGLLSKSWTPLPGNTGSTWDQARAANHRKTDHQG